MAKHELWLLRVQWQLAVVEQCYEHPACTTVQCGRGRKQGRACHAHAAVGQPFTAHHGHVAVAALVAGVGAWNVRCRAG